MQKADQLNWVILDSDWEGEFCRVAESHPKVLAYVKNHNLGLEVPYHFGSEMRKYLPGVNHLGQYGRWAFAEFTEVFQIQTDFKDTIDANFNQLIDGLTP